MTQTLKPLPMPTKAALESVLPRIIIDSREQTPLAFKFPSERGTLATGDYSVRGLEGLFTVERKSIADLVQCCGQERDRFEREMHRLRGYRFKRLLIVGARAEVTQHRYRSAITPASVLGSLAAWECRYDLPVVWAATPEEASELIERWAWYFTREALKQALAITTLPETADAS